jgi:hypothetical protein
LTGTKFTAQSHRYSVRVSPAFDPIDIVLNSVLSLIHLRDLIPARPEYEVGREIIMRLPTAQRNVSQFQKEAVEKTRSVNTESDASGN